MLGIPNELINAANQWSADYHELMEYVHNEEYRKCYYPTQEEIENDPQAKF